MKPTDTDVDRTTEGVWRSRSALALAVRIFVIAGPVLVASLVGRSVVRMLPDHHGWPGDLLALVAAVLVSILLGRFASRLLPLAVLLKMTMIFPDRAPSRVRVARRATSKDELARRLQHPDPDARETAMTMLALVTALGRHDRKTRGHSERVRLYCDLVGDQLGLSPAERGRLRWVGLLHDIGKLDVAASVLNKPGKLSESEWDAIREHPHHGARLAQPLAEWLGPWYEGIEHHHERYDGTGYPNGLAGEEISRAGRTVSVVDAFETMTASRSYKSPMSTVAARAELARCAGTHFDPAVVRAFLAISLPRLLWAMGPLTFLVNFPFLRWIPASSGRVADVAVASANGAATAVSATAVTVAVVASPAVTTQSHSHTSVRLASADHAAPLARSANAGQPNASGIRSSAAPSPSAPGATPAAGGPAQSNTPTAPPVFALPAGKGLVGRPQPTSPSQSDTSADPSDSATGSTPEPGSTPDSGKPTPPTKTPPTKAAPPTKTPPAKKPPAKKPPAKTPPAKTPPAKTPPAKTPRAKTPRAKTPPTKTPPTKTPPAKTPPTKVAPPTKTPPTKTPPTKTPPTKTPPTKTPPKKTH